MPPASQKRARKKAADLSLEMDQIAPSDEDDEYISIFWGILRRPIACANCGTPTRTPSYSGGKTPICGNCFRISIYGH
jgi:hypothetical protein